MASYHGQFVWYELMTTDAAAAVAFYKEVVGWNSAPAGPGMDYTLLKVGDVGVAGVMTIPAEAQAKGAQPGWLGYIAVDDVDAYAEKVRQAGGTVHVPPRDIPTVGRFSMVSAPDGAFFYLFKAAGEMADQPPAMYGSDAVGTVAWRELMAGDGAAAFDFYSRLFGWTKGEAMDMGPMGVYQLFKTGGSADVGGIMTKNAETPHPYWGYYFRVDTIDAATERLTKAGAKVIMGPMEVPGGGWIVGAIDPQGAMFFLTGPKS